MVSFYVNDRRHIPERILLCFFISPAFISIVGEQLIVRLYNFLLDNSVFYDTKNIIFVIMSIFADGLFVYLGGMIFSVGSKHRHFKGATVYMEFVCIERLSLVLAVSNTSYILLNLLFYVLMFLVFRKEAMFLHLNTTINWRYIFIYLVGLFYILDLLFAAYYFFPELDTNSLNPENIVWLDLVAIITAAFVGGYMKVRIAEARAINDKLNYFKKMHSSQEDIIIMLAEISEAKSGETGQHVRRVAEYSKLLAAKLGLSFIEIENIKIAAMMHDLGKLMINQEILEKPGKLTAEEYEIMKQHAQYGYDILAKSDEEIIKMARIIAIEHHEYWDGNGYPNQLHGSQISIFAQIVSVADVFDALTSKRSYKDAWPFEEAVAEIKNQRGKQFSPRVVDAFMDSLGAVKLIHDTYLD